MPGDTLLQLIPEAAGHRLLGGAWAFASGAATATGTNVSLTDTGLIDGSGSITYTGWHLYITADGAGGTPTLVGQDRLVQSVALSGATAQLTISSNRPWARATVTGDAYWLLRDLSRNDWRDLANVALREMRRSVLVTQTGLGANVRRYTPPAGIVRPSDVIDVGFRSSPEVTSDGQPIALRWFGWEENDGTLTLLTDRDIATSQELVYTVLRPYATSGQNSFSADTDTTTAPRDWLVMEMVAGALLTLWTRASDADRPRLQGQLAAAGRIVNAFRHHYQRASTQRAMPLEATF